MGFGLILNSHSQYVKTSASQKPSILLLILYVTATWVPKRSIIDSAKPLQQKIFSNEIKIMNSFLNCWHTLHSHLSRTYNPPVILLFLKFTRLHRIRSIDRQKVSGCVPCPISPMSPHFTDLDYPCFAHFSFSTSDKLLLFALVRSMTCRQLIWHKKKRRKQSSHRGKSFPPANVQITGSFYALGEDFSHLSLRFTTHRLVTSCYLDACS